MIEKIACKLGRNDEVPNIELAEHLSQLEDIRGIDEIVGGLKEKDKAVASDCIKVLYEIGYRKPQLISNYANDFISLLFSNNNRLVWGSMIALSTIADLVPDIIYKNIDKILLAYQHGSVITIDNAITVIAKLCKANKTYEKHLFPVLLEHLQTCQPREVGQHSERAAICINKANAQSFLEILNYRKTHLNEKQVQRIKKLENKIAKQIK